jgi:hypothetical protein
VTDPGPAPAPDEQRGTDPPHTVGPGSVPVFAEPDPAFQLDPGLQHSLTVQLQELSKEHRPLREDVLPYLLVRAFTPGDRAVRPIWPPVACWESPDILLIDSAYTGPFDPTRLVGYPVSGRAYRVFVRVLNLGLVPGVGTHVRAWFVEPGFFSGQSGYEPHPIGGAFIDLEDRTRAGAQKLVELDAPWVIPPGFFGHECLVATVGCVADPWGGVLDVNHDRHVGQRNVYILLAAQSLIPLLAQLGKRVPSGGTLELLHGGAAVEPLLAALVAGKLALDEGGTLGPVVAPDLGSLRRGVPITGGRHLMTAVIEGTRAIVAPSDVLARFAPDPASVGEVFARPGGASGLLRSLESGSLHEIALVGDASSLPNLLPMAVGRMLDIGQVSAASVAKALSGTPGAAHLLRFVATDTEDALVGGYSIVVA